MKNLMMLLCLTVMLRVWWNAPNDFASSGNGIVLNIDFGTADYFIVRQDNGKMGRIRWTDVIKSQWVEVKTEKSAKSWAGE